MKQDIFCPIDNGTGKLIAGKIVRSPQDFEGLLAWLTLDKERGSRELAWSASGEQDPIAAQALLIDAVAGAYIQARLNEANAASSVGLSDTASDIEIDRARALVGLACSELEGLKSAIESEIFEGQLSKSKMTDLAIERLIESFDGKKAMVKSVAMVLSDAAKQDKADAPRLAIEAIRAHFEAKERRSEVKSSGGGLIDDLESSRERLGIFAPLINFIENVTEPSVRTEMLAHLEDYVRSGWFAADVIDKTTSSDCGLGSWWGASHESAAPLREAFEKIGRGQIVPPQEIFNLFKARVLDLSPRVYVSAEAGLANEGELPPCSVERVERHPAGRLFVAGAPSKAIDSLWISPSGEDIYMSCATSDETMARQGDQLARYDEALLASVESGSLGGVSIPAGLSPRIHSRAFSICSVQAKGNEPRRGRQAGESVFACFAKQSSAQQMKLAGFLNALPCMAIIANNSRFGERSVTYGLDFIGDTERGWSKAVAATGKMEFESSRSKTTFALSHFMGAFGACLEKSPLKVSVLSKNAGGMGEKGYHATASILHILNAIMNDMDELPEKDRAACQKALGPGLKQFASGIGAIKMADAKTDKTLLRAVVPWLLEQQQEQHELAQAAELGRKKKQAKEKGKKSPDSKGKKP